MSRINLLLLLVSCIKFSGSVILTEYVPPSTQELYFMKKFGYLPKDETGGLDYAYTAQSISQAVKKIQGFAGIPETGILDDITKQLFHKRRCGIPDIEGYARRKRYVAKKGWDKNIITFKVLNGSGTLSKGRVEELMKKAFDVWAPYGQLQFIKKDGSKADIEIVFRRDEHGDGNPFDGPGNVVAHAFGPPHGGMHFDDDELWGENDLGEDEEITDFYAVAVHEIGHALGLGHSSVRSSIMYPYYQLPISGLGDDDITAMYELYLKPPTPSSMSKLEPTTAPKSTSPTVSDEEKPDLCSTDYYDIIAVLKNHIFVFKGKWLWIFREQKIVNEGYPVQIRQLFRELPHDITINAVYERKDGSIVFFSGREYWVFNTNYQLIRTASTSEYAVPPQVNTLTAAFRSNYNNKTYLFQQERFYRFDEDSWTMDGGYPRSMQAWRNIPIGVVSALVWKGDTYFFKGPRFWRFDNNRIIAHENYPVPTLQVWFGCPENAEMIKYLSYP